MEKGNVTIVGAGLVGTLLACFLAEDGYQVNIFDKRPDPRRTNPTGGRSINLALSHRGWRALREVGLEDEVSRRIIPMKGRLMHDLAGKLTFQPYGLEGQAINSVSRSGLNFSLIQKADGYPNVNFFFNEKCLEVDTEKKAIHFENTHSRYQQLYNYEVLIGADGAFSAVRGALQKTDRFSYAQQYIGHGYKELTIPATVDGDFAMEPNALHIWPRKSFMLIALPNTDETFTLTLFLPYEGEYSFEKLVDEQAVLEFFHSFFPDVVPLIPNLTEEFFQNPTSSLVTIRCAPWSLAEGVLLLGDAAHAIVPFYGQGMNAGFEDCRLLFEILKAHRNNWPTAIKSFQEKRIPDANAIADLAMKNFIEMRDQVADEEFLLRKRLEAKLHQAYPKQWIPLYTMVTFSDTDYAKALKLGQEQEKLITEFLADTDVRKNWEAWDFGKHSAIREFMQKATERLQI